MSYKRAIKFRRVKIKKTPLPKGKIILFIFLGILFFIFIVSFFNNTGLWNAGSVISENSENKTATIRAVIEINDAEHLNSERNFISDITNEVKELDGIWSEEIKSEEYIRITFEKPLTSGRDITIYPNIINGSPKIEVYEVDGTELIAEFTSINSNEYNKVLLTNLVGEQDVFDLRVIDGSLEIEHIVDPLTEYLSNPSFTNGVTDWTLDITTYDDTTYQDTAGSIYTTPGVGRNTAVIGTTTQTISTSINSDDTVAISLYWKKNWDGAIPKVQLLEAQILKPSGAGDWINAVPIWSDSQLGVFDWTFSSADVSSYFDEIGTYEFRFYMDAGNANDKTANTHLWIDNTSLEVTTPVDYPQFSDYAVNESQLKKNQYAKFNVSVSDPDGISYVNGTIEGTTYDFTQGSGNEWYYDLWQCTSTNSAVDFTWVGANDTDNNWNSTTINGVSTNCDANLPIISDWNANVTTITQNNYFCINVTATDVGTGVNTVLAKIWNTTNWYNISMTNTEKSCGGGGDVYSADIQGTAVGIWNYSRVYANDTAGNMNSSDFADKEINVTAPADTYYPQFSNPQENPANDSDYSYGQSYQFNSTVINTNGTIYLSFDNTNYSASNVSDEFYVDFASLSAGTYDYFWWGYGNGTNKNYNQSDIRVYVVQKTNPGGSLTNNDSWTITYPTTVQIGYDESNDGDGGIVYKVYRDGADKGSGETVTLGYGNYDYVLNTTGGTNYTSNSSIDAQTLNVNKNTGTCDVSFNETSPIIYPAIFKIWTNCTSDFTLYRNGTTISNNSEQNLAASSYNFSVIRTDTANYSNYYDEESFVVQKATSEIATYINNQRDNESVLFHSEKWLNATLETGSGNIKLYYNNTLINQGPSPLSNLTNFTQEGEFNVSGIYDGNENYTSDIETWWVTVSTDSAPAVTLNSPIDYYNSSSTSMTFNCTGEDDINLVNVSLYGNWSGWHLNDTNSSPVNNAPVIFDKTISDGIYVWNCKACDSISQCSFASANYTFSVDTTYPIVNIVYPQNDTYTVNVSELNYTAEDDGGLDKCWWSNNSGIWNSSPQTCGTNWTGLTSNEGSNTWTVWANDTAGNENSSSVTFNKDTTYPQFSDFQEYPLNDSDYSYEQSYQFNVTVINTNGTVWIRFDGTNYTAENLTTDEYNVTLPSLSVGTYNYNWSAYGDGTLNNFNISGTRTYVLNKAIPTGSLTTNDTWTIIYPTTVQIGYSENNGGDGGVVYKVYRDNVDKGSGETVTLGFGTYDYVLNTTGGANYTANVSIDTETLTVNKNTDSCGVVFNESSGITYPSTFRVWTNCTSDFVLYRNSSAIDNNSEQALAASSYNFSVIRNDTVNYSNYYNEREFIVNKATPTLTKKLNGADDNLSINYPTEVNASASTTGGTVNIYRNSTDVTNENNLNVSLAVSYYEYEFNITGNENYTDVNSVFLYATVNKGTSEVATYIDNVRNNESVLLNSEKWLNATLITPGSGNIELWYNDTLIEEGPSPLYNLTNFTSEGEFNVSGFYDGNENYTSAYETWWVTVSTDSAPTVNIVYPENISYNSDVTQLNYTVEDDIDLDTCWYSTNGGAINETIITCGDNVTGLTANEGSNNWTVYANDSIGQESSDIIFFTKDTIYPTFSNYLRNPDPPNEDEDIQVNVTITEDNLDNTILEWNGTTNYTVITSNGNQYYFTVAQENYTAHDSITYYWYANDTAGNMNRSEQQSFTVANQAPILTVNEPDGNNDNTKTTFNVTWSASDNDDEDTLTISCYGDADSSDYNKTYTCFTETANDGSENCSVSSWEEDTYYIWCNATDTYNSTLDYSPGELTIDKTGPLIESETKDKTPNEDQDVQLNATVTVSGVGLDTVWVNVSVNNTAETKFIVTSHNGDEYYFTLDKGNYTAHDIVNWTYHANDTLDNLGSGTMQSFTVANQIPSVSQPLINDTIPLTNDILNCTGGDFSDNDAEDDTEQARYFKWYDTDVEIPGQTSQTLNLSVSGLDKGDVINCSVRVYDGYDNSTWTNSSNTATIQNSPPVITNPQTTVDWDANESTYNYDYEATDADSGDSFTWYDNTTLFDINSTTGVISDTPTEDEAGTYSIRINVSDGTVNTTDDFTYTIIDVTYPIVNMVYPENNTDYTINVSQLNYTYTETNPDKCWWSNNSGAWNSSPQPCGTNWTGLTSIEGPNTWTVYINDTSGNENSSSVTFNKDTAYPAVIINSPLNETYNTNLITFNITATDGSDVDSCWYSLTAGSYNYSMTETNPPEWDDTNSSMTQGPHTVNFYCNDTSNNLNNTEQETFFIDSIVPYFTDGTPQDQSISYKVALNYDINATDTGLGLDSFNVNDTRFKINSTSGLLENNTILGVNEYYLNITINDTVNNLNSTIMLVNITKISSEVNLTLNGTRGNVAIDQYSTIWLNGTLVTGDSSATLELYNNDSPINQGPSPLNNSTDFNEIGVFNITVFYIESPNYTGSYETWWVNVTEAPDQEAPSVTLLTERPEEPVNYSEGAIYEFNATVTDSPGVGLDTVLLDFNGTNYSATNLIGDIYNVTLIDLTVGTYDYKWWANDTNNNINNNENGTYTIDQATPSLSLTITPSISETYGTETTTNGTGCPSQLTCNFYRNDTGEITPPDVVTLSVGAYNYTYNTTGNVNYTSVSVSDILTINQDTSSCSVVFNESSPITYPNIFTVWTNCTSGFVLYRNGTTIENNSEQSLGVNSYNFTVIRNDTVNYSNYYNEEIFIVQQAIGVVYVYLNNSRSNITLEQYTEIYLNATLETGSGTIKLYNNETLINQGASPLSNLTNFTSIYLYNITAIYDGNENYSSDSETRWVNVTELDVTPPQISITYPQNTSYNSVQTQLNYTAWDNFGLNECWYSLNNGVTNTTITCGQNKTGLNSGQGSSTWRVYADDAKGNENSSSVTFFVDSINPTIQFVSPTETSGISLGRNDIQINVTANDTNLDKIVIRLYNSTSLLETNISASGSLINYTGLSADTYYFNATANDIVGNNISTETRNISLVLPELTIIKPENETYIHTNNLLLNYTADYEDYVWYNINQTGDNETITGNTTFNTVQGQHTFYLYANNTLGETAKNVTFSVDINKFRVIYDEFKDEGGSTNFNQSSYEDLQNASNVALEDTDYGKIQFNEVINLTNDANVSDNEIDLDTYTNISENHIEINSTALPNFNKSATLYLYNLTLNSPVSILRDDSVCPSTICTQQSYSGGTLIFNVTQFTVYSAEETSVTQPPDGGGGAGELEIYECVEDSECEEDEICWNHKCVKLFDIKIIDFDSPVHLGEFFEFTYFIKGMADINEDIEVHFWIEKEGEVVTSGSDTIYLGSFEEKTETTKIFLPTNTKSGIYQFYVEVYHQAYQAKSHRTIEIQVKDGVAVIGDIDFGVIQKYLIMFLIALIIVIIAFIVHSERKKIKMGLIHETKWIKKHKISVLTSLLAIIVGLTLYFVGFFEFLAIKFSEAVLWFKANLSYIVYGILILGLITIIVSIFRSKKIHEKFGVWERKRRKEKFFKRKYKRRVREAKKKFFKPKKRLSKKVINFISKLFSKAGFFIRRLERSGLKTIKKTEKEIPKVSKFGKEISKIKAASEKNIFKFISLLRKEVKNLFKKRIVEKPEKKPKIVHKKEKIKKKKHIFKKLYTKFSSGIKKAGLRIKRFFNKAGKLVRGEIRKEKPLKRGGKFEPVVLKGKKEISKEGTKFIKKTEKEIDEIYRDLLGFLNKLFGKKKRRIIIKDFKEFFAPKNKRIIKKHLGTLEELEKLRKLSKKKIKGFSGGFSKEGRGIRKKVALLINDLSEFFKDNELIQTKKERKKIEQMVKTYSKEIFFIRRFLRKTRINTKYFLKISDEYIYESLDSFKKEIGKILKKFKKEKNAKVGKHGSTLKKKPETQKDIIENMVEKEEEEKKKETA